MTSTELTGSAKETDFRERVRRNQQALASTGRTAFDYIVCGAGSSGSVVAGRLAEDPAVQVLLLEAGRSDNIPEINDPEKWLSNLGTSREWGFHTQAIPALNGRSMPYAMGRVLGGGSSINTALWARGHKQDWNYFAEVSGDDAWGYNSVRQLYRKIEDFHGTADPEYRGSGGPVYLENSQAALDPFYQAALEAAELKGVVRFDNPNGRMMEGSGGCSTTDRIIRQGSRQSLFRAYTLPKMVQPNLTVLPDALVTRLIFSRTFVTGVEASVSGVLQRFACSTEVIVSLGAVQTPKLLMQSGIGDETELGQFGIPVVQHLPGVGRNLQDHPCVSCIWEFKATPTWQSSLADAVVYWRSDSQLHSPDLLMFPFMMPYTSAESAARFQPKPQSWSLISALLQPRSRGRIRLSGAQASDPPVIEAGILSDSADLETLTSAASFSRELGHSKAFDSFRGTETIPRTSNPSDLQEIVREATGNFSHQACTAAMGKDVMSVVDSELKVYGVDRLRIADASVLPKITTGNTMGPCVVIGERAAELVQRKHRNHASR